MLAAVAENAHSGMTSARSISASVGIATYDSMLAWLIQCQYPYSMGYGYIVQLRCVNRYFHMYSHVATIYYICSRSCNLHRSAYPMWYHVSSQTGV